jgi:hypothetical protein
MGALPPPPDPGGERDWSLILTWVRIPDRLIFLHLSLIPVQSTTEGSQVLEARDLCTLSY